MCFVFRALQFLNMSKSMYLLEEHRRGFDNYKVRVKCCNSNYNFSFVSAKVLNHANENRTEKCLKLIIFTLLRRARSQASKQAHYHRPVLLYHFIKIK